MRTFFKSFKTFLYAQFERKMLVLEGETTKRRVSDLEPHNYDLTIV